MPASGNKPGADVTNRTVDRRQFLLGCTTCADGRWQADGTVHLFADVRNEAGLPLPGSLLDLIPR